MPPLISGVTLKVGAAAVAAAYVGSNMVTGTPWTPAVLLTGSAFTAAQIAPGMSGLQNTISNVNRIYLASGRSFWSGWITGSSATLAMNNDFVNYPGAMLVSVDGGAYSAVSNTSTVYTLFSGLSDTEHFVSVCPSGAYSTVAYFDKSAGNILNITGASPSIRMCNGWVFPGVTDALSFAAGATVVSTTNFTPVKMKFGATVASNIGAAIVKGPFKSLVVSSTGDASITAVWVSKNGASPTKYTIPSTSAQGVVTEIQNLGGASATYNVWVDHQGSNQRMFSVSGDTAHIDVGAKKQLHQFGDSITYGVGGLGEVDTLRVAASMGFAGLTLGVSGQTTAQLDTVISGYLANLTVTASDVVILAIGRNDSGAFNATVQTAYTSIVNKLLAKGYGKVICRAVLPAGNHPGTAQPDNSIIQSLVTAIGNANAVFMDTSGCPAYTTVSNDQTHPDATGYGVIAAYVEPLYRTILGL